MTDEPLEVECEELGWSLLTMGGWSYMDAYRWISRYRELSRGSLGPGERFNLVNRELEGPDRLRSNLEERITRAMDLLGSVKARLRADELFRKLDKEEGDELPQVDMGRPDGDVSVRAPAE